MALKYSLDSPYYEVVTQHYISALTMIPELVTVRAVLISQPASKLSASYGGESLDEFPLCADWAATHRNLYDTPQENRTLIISLVSIAVMRRAI